MQFKYLQVSCPICAEWIGQAPVVELLPNVIVTNLELTEFLAFVNQYASHIVQAHTDGLSDDALAKLFLILVGNGLADEFETWKKLFSVAE